jgi:hypothetical protein
MKHWEIHRRQSQQSRLELGCIAAIDSDGRTIWIADAHHDDGKRFVERAEEKLTAFLELERVTREFNRLPKCQIIRHILTCSLLRAFPGKARK